MPKKVTQPEFDAVVQAVARLVDGGAIDAISAALVTPLPLRTLQRRLAMLVAQRRLTVEGRGRASRYRENRNSLSVPYDNDLTVRIHHRAESPIAPYYTHRATTAERAPAPDYVLATPGGEKYIPISVEAETLRQAIRQPLHYRKPVGYNRAFLDAYRPNQTFYLPAQTCERLLQLGRSTHVDLPAGTYVRQVYDRLLIDLSWNSSRLEGNTYSLLETERLLELGESADGKNTREAQMILNHKAAIELLVEQATEINFNSYTILNLHALLADNLLEPRACGRLRKVRVGIDGTVFLPLEVPQLIDECFQQILDTAAAIADPFEQAFFVMVQLPYLQPFEDVNKRVSRLAANVPFIRGNLSPLSFVDLPGRAYIDGILAVYELNRVELLRDAFVWAYERSCKRYSAVRQSLGAPDPFRMRYRVRVAEAVAATVSAGLDKKAATAHIRRCAVTHIPQADQAQFIEVVETELSSLHEGNIARYRIRPLQFAQWRQTWH